MKFTAYCLILLGFAVAVFYLVDTAAASRGGGAIVMPLSAAAAVLAGAALLRYGGTGYRQTKVAGPAVRELPGKSWWW